MDTKEKKEKYFVNIEKRSDEKGIASAYACINGKTFLVPKGKNVEVPRSVAKIYECSKAAIAECDEYTTATAQN